jgi:tetratricopeptide (TPR) repeat protein
MTAENVQVSIADVKNAHQRLSDANECISRGDMAGASQICQQLLEEHPDYSGALSMLAIIYMQQANYSTAFPHLVKASMLNPNDPSILANLGKVYHEFDAGECAMRCLEKANAINPNEPMTYYFMGEVMLQRQDFVRAEEFFQKLLELQPSNTSGKIRLGISQAKMERSVEAASTFKSSLEMPLSREEKALLLYMLSELPSAPEGIDILEALDEMSVPQPQDSEITGHLINFARGVSLDKKGNFKEAWNCFTSANQKISDATVTERQTYLKQARALVDKAINWQPSKIDTPASNSNDLPVSLFILGPSRSGKTSLENLIGSVDGVKTGFEHNIVKDTAKRAAQKADLLSEDQLSNISSELNELSSRTYHEALSRHGGDARFLTITHPGAISDVGRLVDCVPEARFIFMKRDLDDNALRIFGYFYSPNTNQFASNIKDIYEYLDLHNRMIDNWLDKLGTKAMLISYEELAKNPEGTLERVCKFCGLKPPSKSELQTGNDTGCAEPYRKWLGDAQKQGS